MERLAIRLELTTAAVYKLVFHSCFRKSNSSFLIFFQAAFLVESHVLRGKYAIKVSEIREAAYGCDQVAGLDLLIFVSLRCAYGTFFFAFWSIRLFSCRDVWYFYCRSCRFIIESLNITPRTVMSFRLNDSCYSSVDWTAEPQIFHNLNYPSGVPHKLYLQAGMFGDFRHFIYRGQFIFDHRESKTIMQINANFLNNTIKLALEISRVSSSPFREIRQTYASNLSLYYSSVWKYDSNIFNTTRPSFLITSTLYPLYNI